MYRRSNNAPLIARDCRVLKFIAAIMKIIKAIIKFIAAIISAEMKDLGSVPNPIPVS